MNITIPPAVEEAGGKFIFDSDPETVIPWHMLSDAGQTTYRARARAAFEAMVRAWPGMQIGGGFILDKHFHDIILPLTQEASDE